MFVSSSRTRISNYTIKQIKAQFDANLSVLLGKEEVLESIKTPEKETFILRNGIPIIHVESDRYVPLVKCVHMAPDMLTKVVVDEGAIKHLINGADVMAPGLLQTTSEYPSVSENDLVAIYGYGKTHALGVGVVVMSSSQVEEIRNGVAIKIVSRLGDKLYSYS
ncbi:malignant T-cell-amplified sequence [Nematocida sp. AWRm77]|nr:malignant T-cell-amplified sequence [Nematocida sp. AWRm77]